MLLAIQHISVSTGTAQKETLANSSRPLPLVRSCCVESNFCSARFAQYFSTRVPVSGFIRASANSERCSMTGNEDNVGFLATGSGVQQFQLSSCGCFVLQRRRFSQELRSTQHAGNPQASAAVQNKTGAFDSQATVRGTPPSGVAERVPVRAYQCLIWGVGNHALFILDIPKAN